MKKVSILFLLFCMFQGVGTPITLAGSSGGDLYYGISGFLQGQKAIMDIQKKTDGN